MAQAVEAPAGTMAEGQDSHTQKQEQPSIYELMARVMNDVRDVGKNGFNNHHKYSFRGVDDFIGALAQPLRAHGVFMMTEILDFQVSVRGSMNATHMRVAFHFYGPAGDKVTATTLGEASDTADKSSNKAMSAALKYALMQTFMIPVDAASLDDGDRDHPVGQRSPADGYMERLRKPSVWNNVGALTAMHTEAKADGLLNATVYGPGGDETTLGELIVARGTVLKQEAAEREKRKAEEAGKVAAQVAAETGGSVRVGNVVIDRDCFVPHPDGQDFANQAALATSREAVESLRATAAAAGIVNSGVTAPDTGEPDVLDDYFTRRAAELASAGEGEPDVTAAQNAEPSERLAALLRQVSDCWKSSNPLIWNQIREDGDQHGVLDEEFTGKRGAVTTLRKVLDARVAEIQAAQAGGESRAA